jgi:hypothetical protein
MIDLTPKYFRTTDGDYLGLHTGRWDEHHRRRRTVLPERASSWDYAPLIDMIRPANRFREFRYVGMTVHEWLERLRSRRDPQYQAAVNWYFRRIGKVRRKLDQRPRVPDNAYAVVLADVPVQPALPAAVTRFGPKRATVAEWRAMLTGLSARGVRGEELQRSGLLGMLDAFEASPLHRPSTTLTREWILDLINLDHLRPRIVVECSHGFDTQAGWRECCEVVRVRQGRRRGAIGNGRNDLRVIRYRHRTFGWSLMRLTYFPDLLRDRADRWYILNERGGPVLHPKGARMERLDVAMAAAECAMSERFRQWRRGIESQQWKAYSLPGGNGYRELLVQLHDWPNNYQPRHYRTRNVLIHLRTSIRTDADGRRVLYLDEAQSDWHSDVHTESRGASNPRGRPPTPPAPFAKEWPLLAMKIALWWAQKLRLDGLAWSTAELQRQRWGLHGPPESLYARELPNAAAQIARTLCLDIDSATLQLRDSLRQVTLTRKGWIVCGPDQVPHTKPFRSREQAEFFADQTAQRVAIALPCLWITKLAPIIQLPLFGPGSQADWLGTESGCQSQPTAEPALSAT